MGVRSFLQGIKAGRPLMTVMVVGWAALAILSAKLWSDATWRETASSNPQALARRALAELAAEKKPAPARLAAAERLVRAELRFGPYRPSAWCRLAYVQFLRAGRLDERASQSLRRSYELAPYESDAFLWRTQFVFEHWDEAPMDLRQAALRETRAFYSQWENRRQIEMMAARVYNPAGRLALQLVLLQAPLPGAPRS